MKPGSFLDWLGVVAVAGVFLCIAGLALYAILPRPAPVVSRSAPWAGSLVGIRAEVLRRQRTTAEARR